MFDMRYEDKRADSRFLDLRLAALQVTIAQSGGVTKADGSPLTVDDFRLLQDDDDPDDDENKPSTTMSLDDKWARFEKVADGWAKALGARF